MKKKNATLRPRGRPREFDRDEALDRAVTTFWMKGYSGTSLDDLTENMGISRPSLYATFGSKHDLFMEVIDRYSVTLGCQPVKAFYGDPDIKKAVAAFFKASIHCVTSDGPKGCLIVSVTLEDAEMDSQIRKKLAGIFTETDKVIVERFLVAQDEGQLPQESNPKTLARMIISITHSFAARARVGANRKTLTRLANEFMTVLFPTPI